MPKEVRCADITGDCSYVARGATESDVMEDVAAHARDVHNIQTISPQLARKVQEAVHESEAPAARG
jgi:predicted small metal-binding protein